MESLQLAQILADLSSLNAAEPQAADALLKANKELRKAEALPAPPTSVPSKRLEHADVKRTSSASRTASPAKFDKYGRRILMSPPLSRTNSGQGSHPGTPRRESDAEDEVDRASTLMALYEIRSKLKQQDNSSLLKAREKISALAARQQAEADKMRGPAGAASTTAGSSSAPTTKHYPYTYPK